MRFPKWGWRRGEQEAEAEAPRDSHPRPTSPMNDHKGSHQRLLVSNSNLAGKRSEGEKPQKSKMNEKCRK